MGLSLFLDLTKKQETNKILIVYLRSISGPYNSRDPICLILKCSFYLEKFRIETVTSLILMLFLIKLHYRKPPKRKKNSTYNCILRPQSLF